MLEVCVNGDCHNYLCVLLLLQRTERTSMPNIFIEGQSIGGCNDGPGLMTLKRNGKLEGMLKTAGAL